MNIKKNHSPLLQIAMTQPFVAVHVGAGFHSDANSKELKSLCKRACKQAMDALGEGLTSSEAVVLATSILEDSYQTNAALGSNLGLSGSVECDASVMDGEGNFGAVGAVEGVVNPIKLAHTLLMESSQGCLPLGRVPPVVLVGSGAHLWASQHQIATCPPDDLITDRARAVYLDHVGRLEEVTQDVVTNGTLSERTGDGLVSHGVGVAPREGEGPAPDVATASGGTEAGLMSCRVRIKKSYRADVKSGEWPCRKKPRVSENNLISSCGPGLAVKDAGSRHLLAPSSTPCRAPLDTVGAICLDAKGGVAAGVSSGGISLKSPGRVGQATMFGCGCWADNVEVGGNSRAVACSTSGTGEYIIKTSLAKECALAMVDSSLHIALDEHFLNSKRLRNVDQKLAGAIVLNLTSDKVLHFSWGHTTESMCIGFMAATHKEPTAIISKMENPEKSGLVSHVQALRIHC